MAASSINLLPVELSPQSGAAKTANLFKRIAIVYGAIVVVFLLGAGAFILFMGIQTNNVKQENANLGARIATLEAAEQKTVLIRDRLQKIKTITGGGATISKNLANLDRVISILPSGIVIASAEVDSVRTKFTVSGNSSQAITDFLSNLVAQRIYTNLILKTFSYNPGSGYVVSFDILEAN